MTSQLLDSTLARRLERLTLITRRRLIGQGQGDRRSLRKGSSLEFADYRHYTPGDDPGRIDWSIYARTNSLFVRVYEEEEVLNVHLVVDASRSMDYGEPNKLAYARKLAAALGYMALNASNRLYVWPLDAAGSTFGPSWGRNRAGPFLQFLADLHPGQASTPPIVPLSQPTPPDLDTAIGKAYSSRVAGLTVLISDLQSPSWDVAIRRIAGRAGDAVVLHVLSPEELRPRLGGDVRLIDRETGGVVSVTLNNDALRMYGERLDAWRRQIETLCGRLGVSYVAVDTAVPVETIVFDTLRRRGVVR